MDILFSSNRIIDVKVKIGSLCYFMSFVYGDHVRQRRQELWNMLQDIGEHRTGGWFLVRDFNEIMNNGEKLRGHVRQESSFFSFRSMVREYRIKEVSSSGNVMSWAGVREIITNGLKKNVWVQCRLDRAFRNAEWFRLFPKAHTTYLEKLGSDHRPVFTSLAKSIQGRTCRFCFDRDGAQNQKFWKSYGKVGTFKVQDRLEE